MHLSSQPPYVAARRTALRAAVAIGSVLLVGVADAAAQTTSVASGAGRRSQQRAGPLACDTGWSAPRMLRTSAGQPIYVEAPVTVASTNGTYLIGAPTFVWADSTAFATPDSRRDIAAVGVKLLNDSTAIPLPPLPSAKKPYMPIAVARGAALVAVWGSSADTSLAGVFSQDTLWEATLAAGRWSAARPIWTSAVFRWHPGAASYVADDASLSIAFPAALTGNHAGRGVAVMTRSRDRWRTRLIHVGNGNPNGVAAMRLSESELLLAVVGSIDRDGVRALNAGYSCGSR